MDSFPDRSDDGKPNGPLAVLGDGAARILRLQACNGKVGVSENPGIPFAGARMRYERLLDAGWRLGASLQFCGFFVAVGRMHFRPHRKGFQTTKGKTNMSNHMNDPRDMHYDDLVSLVRTLQRTIWPDPPEDLCGSEAATERDLATFDKIVSILNDAHLGFEPDISFRSEVK